MHYRSRKQRGRYRYPPAQMPQRQLRVIDIIIDWFRSLFRLRRREQTPAPRSFLPAGMPPPLPLRSAVASPATPPPLPGVAAPMPYRRAPHLLSKGERAFWHPLYLAVKRRYRIFHKVRLSDVIRCPPSHPEERRWFRRISRFHVDFVICDPKTTEPLLVVELDDRRHRRRRNQERDRFKDEVLRAAGMPILRVRAQQAYDPLELAEQIDRLLGVPRR